MLLILIDIVSVSIIAIVCMLAIVKYHRQFGLIITLTLLFLMLSCISVVFDEHDGSRDLYSLELFRFLVAISSIIIYVRFRHFWMKYGVVIMALNQDERIT